MIEAETKTLKLDKPISEYQRTIIDQKRLGAQNNQRMKASNVYTAGKKRILHLIDKNNE